MCKLQIFKVIFFTKYCPESFKTLPGKKWIRPQIEVDISFQGKKSEIFYTKIGIY